jgi:hypothetical protein
MITRTCLLYICLSIKKQLAISDMKKILPLFICFCLFDGFLRAQMVSYHLQQSFTKNQLDSFLQTTGFSLPIAPQYDIDIYQVIYKTPYKHIDSLVNASGIVVFPKNASCPSGLGCYTHGTFTRRDQCPSYNGPERPIGFFFAGIGGVVTTMPDELGLGDCDSSVLIHPYINAFHTGNAALNIMRAARQLADTLHVQLSGEVLLTGYSQGGYSTAAVARLIQEQYSNEFNVVGLAPMSGPYDLNVTMVNQMLSTTPYATPSYLPYLLLGYHSVYPQLQQMYPNPSDIFKHPYDSILPPMYYSKQFSTGQIDAFCTPVPRDMIKDSVLMEFENNPNHPLRLILAENDMLGWAPAKPTKIHYCTADEQVPYLNAVRADSAWTANGAPNLQISNGGNLNHGGCVQPSLTSAALFLLGKLSTCTGITEPDRNTFGIFPNPTNGKVVITKESGTNSFRVINVNGQAVYATMLPEETNPLDLSFLPAGIYVAELTAANGHKVLRKIVRQ